MKHLAWIVVIGLIAWLAAEQTTAQPQNRMVAAGSAESQRLQYEAQHGQAAGRSGSRVWQYTLVTRLVFPATQKAIWAVTGTATFKLGDEVKIPDMLNPCGAAGWDLVTLTESESDGMRVTTFYFKRLIGQP